jgi:hypothetical protein
MQDHLFTLGHTQGQQLTEECTREALYILDIIQEAHIVMAETLEVLFTDGIQDTHIVMAETLEVLLVTDKTQIQSQIQTQIQSQIQTQIQKIHVAVADGRNTNSLYSVGEHKMPSIFSKWMTFKKVNKLFLKTQLYY